MRMELYGKRSVKIYSNDRTLLVTKGKEHFVVSIWLSNGDIIVWSAKIKRAYLVKMVESAMKFERTQGR